ncbi:MAG: ThuA domain-containing protein, partial [Verrucomicrobiae bacterium]|nr:ThuA domain-containing protein [Verrucomicrobiae bacterium]
NGWPENEAIFDGAKAVVVYSDGNAGHPVNGHEAKMSELAAAGVGIMFMHYAVEVPPGERGELFKKWVGGHYESGFSVNPHWTASDAPKAGHPIGNGVPNLRANDEWYFNMRFAKDMQGVTPILSSVAPDETMSRPDGEHSGNPEVRKMVAEKQPQHVCWVIERADGGRGFGFTGLHFHDNWANDDFRKTVLNAICWIAKVEIPAEGIVTPTPTQEELDANLDPKPAKPKPKPAPAQKKAA